MRKLDIKYIYNNEYYKNKNRNATFKAIIYFTFKQEKNINYVKKHFTKEKVHKYGPLSLL